jgi:hypothetical protein
MRFLYSNRRLSIQPDSIVIPSAESADGPLVHDILDHLGLLGGDGDTDSAAGLVESPRSRPILKGNQTSASSSTSVYDNSLADATPMFSHSFTDISSMPDFDVNDIDLSLDTDMGLNFPYEVYSSINMDMTGTGIGFGSFTPDLSLPQNMSPQDWCPLDVLEDVMNMPAGQMWLDESAFPQYSY